jgi:hypothetical protein
MTTITNKGASFIEQTVSLQGFEIILQRNAELKATDWWGASDRTMTEEQTAYRQALRDITAQSGFPASVAWPTKPE